MAGSPGAKVVGRLALKVLPDTSEFVPKLRAFAERVEKQIRIEIPVTLDRKQALAEMKVLRTQLEVAAANDIEIDVGVDGSKARREMVGLVGQLKAMQSVLPAIGSGGSNVTSMFGRWGAILGVVFALVVSLGPALAVLVPLTGGLVLGGLAVFAAWDKVKKLFAELKPEWQSLKEAVGSELVKGLQPLISALGSKFFPVLQAGLVKMAEVLNIGFQSLGQWLTSPQGLSRVGKAFDAIAMAMQPFANLITPLTSLFVELSIAAAPALKLIGDALVDVTSRFAEWLGQGNGTQAITDAVKDIGKFLVIVGRAAKDAWPVLQEGMKVLIPLLDGMQIGFGVVMKVIKPFFSFLAKHKTTMGILGTALVLIAAFFGAIALVAGIAISLIGATVAIIFSLILVVIELWNWMKGLGPVFAAVWAAIVGWTVQAWTAIKTWFVVGMAAVHATWTAGWNKVKSIVSTAWSVIKSAVVGAVANVTGRMAAAWAKIKSGVQTAWDAVVKLVKTAWTNLRSTVTTGVANVISKVSELPGQILDLLDFDLAGAGEKLMQGLADGIAEIGEVTIQNVRNIVQKIRDLLPGSPIKTGPLKSWNRGGAGIRLMGLLAYGIKRGGRDVQTTMARTLAGVSSGTVFAPVFDPASVNSLTGSMTAQIGAIVDHSTDRSAQEIIIDWETGRGVMRDIAQGAVAAKEFTNKQASIMGATR